MAGKWSCTRDNVQGIPLQTLALQTRAGLMGAALFHCGNRPCTAYAFEKANPVVAESGTVANSGMIRMLAGSYARILRVVVLQAMTMTKLNGAHSALVTAQWREGGQGQVLLFTSRMGVAQARHGGAALTWHSAEDAGMPALVALLRKTVTMEPMRVSGVFHPLASE